MINNLICIYVTDIFLIYLFLTFYQYERPWKDSLIKRWIGSFKHRLKTIQIEHYMSSFQDLGFFSFTKTLRQTPKGVTRVLALCLVIQLLNLKKTTSNVLSVLLLIYDYKDMINTRFDLIWLKVKKIISCLISSIRNRFT